MTALEALRTSADADVYLSINGDTTRLINGARHCAGVSLFVEYADGHWGAVELSAGAEVTVVRIDR